MSKYSDLQGEAKRLGLKYVGVSAKKLKESILEAQNLPDSPVEPEVGEVKKVNKKANAAIIRKGKHEVRRYTAQIHGENFAELADNFVQDREGCVVELTEVKPGITCPDCGNTIYT
jgi:hypothetical protein